MIDAVTTSPPPFVPQSLSGTATCGRREECRDAWNTPPYVPSAHKAHDLTHGKTDRITHRYRENQTAEVLREPDGRRRPREIAQPSPRTADAETPIRQPLDPALFAGPRLCALPAATNTKPDATDKPGPNHLFPAPPCDGLAFVVDSLSTFTIAHACDAYRHVRMIRTVSGQMRGRFTGVRGRVRYPARAPSG